MPELSGAMRKRRMGTAKKFTLLLLLYLTQPKAYELLQIQKHLQGQQNSRCAQQYDRHTDDKASACAAGFWTVIQRRKNEGTY